MERGKSQAAIQSPDSVSPAGVMFSAISIYTHSDMRKAGRRAFVSLSLGWDVQKSASHVNSVPGDLPVNSRGTAPSHTGDVKNSM